MPKTSVIVPVYNVKDYLAKCVASILGQTERDFELLLIDDGSTDGSGALCDSLAETDSRVQVIHQENQGLGGARDTGIDNARGEWLMFVDSDDWIEPDVLEKALVSAEREDADIAVFPFRSVDETGRELRRFSENIEKEIGFSPEGRKDFLLISPSAWNKLFRASLFAKTGARFPHRVWYEDIRTTPKLLTAARRVVFLKDVGYNYLQRTGSITKNANIDRNREILEAFDDLLSWFKDRGKFDAYREELEFLTLYHAYLAASVRVIRIDKNHPILKEFSEYLEKNFPNYRKNSYLTRLTRNERLLYKLLEHGYTGLIALIFKIKG